MGRYRVRIEGRNFVLQMEGESPGYRSGFFVTRDVDGASPDEAEANAIHLIRDDDHIKSITLNPKSDPPMLYIDSIRELKVDEESLNNSGYVFYTGDEES